VVHYSLKEEITNDDWETACKAMLELPLPNLPLVAKRLLTITGPAF
jgi:hypothetical protein